MSAATKMNTAKNKLSALFACWLADLKTQPEPEPLPQAFWKIILVTGALLLFSFSKASFDTYADNIAQLMAEYSIENSKSLFFWFNSDSLCLFIIEVFVLSLWGSVYLTTEYLYDFADNGDRPTLAATLRLLVLGAPLTLLMLSLSHWLSRLALPADVPDLVVWLMQIDNIFKFIGPILLIELAKFHIYESKDAGDYPAHPEIT
jgi:hypothetical protein